MNQTFQKILVILLVSLTATACVLIPEITGNGLSPTLLISYVILLGTSLSVRKTDIALLLIGCGLALPAAEFIWVASYSNWDWTQTGFYVQKQALAFSFVGSKSYAITCFIAPIAIFLSGNMVRQYRREKSQRQEQH